METERMLLRPWLDSDAETLFKYASDSDVGPRAGWPPHKFVEGSLEIIRTVFNTIVYTATVELTDNLNTTYKKKIPFIQQMTGQANIITEEMTLLDQIIRPIYSLFKN